MNNFEMEKSKLEISTIIRILNFSETHLRNKHFSAVSASTDWSYTEHLSYSVHSFEEIKPHLVMPYGFYHKGTT